MEDPYGYIPQISSEIDSVLKNLQILNRVFTHAKLNYDNIFWTLWDANKDLLSVYDGPPTVLKEDGKHEFFLTSLHQKPTHHFAHFTDCISKRRRVLCLIYPIWVSNVFIFHNIWRTIHLILRNDCPNIFFSLVQYYRIKLFLVGFRLIFIQENLYKNRRRKKSFSSEK